MPYYILCSKTLICVILNFVRYFSFSSENKPWRCSSADKTSAASGYLGRDLRKKFTDSIIFVTILKRFLDETAAYVAFQTNFSP